MELKLAYVSPDGNSAIFFRGVSQYNYFRDEDKLWIELAKGGTRLYNCHSLLNECKKMLQA